jgi:hypothetical protein
LRNAVVLFPTTAPAATRRKIWRRSSQRADCCEKRDGFWRLSTGPMTMHRTEIVRQLHQLLDARLFGTAAWPVNGETADRNPVADGLLVEEVPGEANTWRNTPLGSELHINLVQVFIGCWDEWEIPTILDRRIRPHRGTGRPPPLASSQCRCRLGANVFGLCTSGILCILQPNSRTQLTKREGLVR